MRMRFLVAGLAASLLSGTATAYAAGFPERPVEMTVLFGGSAQTTAQILAQLMSKQLGQPVVPVSRPGGGGAVGYSYVANQPATGYSIVWNSNSISTAHYQGNLPITYEAFAPIAQVTIEVPAVAVNSGKGWKSLGQMAEAAKKSGQPLKVGISGFGSFTHLVAAALFNKIGVKAIYIPYGEGRAPAELLGGRIDVAVQWPSQFISEAKAGKLDILCVTSDKRLETLKDTPTCSEAGAKGLNLTLWRGLEAPKGTPKEAIEKIEAAAKAAVASPEFQKAGEHLGFEPAFLPADKFGEVIAKDDKEIATLMQELGLKKK